MIGFRVHSGPLALAVVLLVGSVARPTVADEPTGLQAAIAIEASMIEAIARAEPSVVAIARVRRTDKQPLDFQVNRFGRLRLPEATSPSQPEFIPNEFATGVVIGADGLILTANHVVQEDCDYYVTTSERKAYKVVSVVGGDPRSDLAVFKIDARGLPPIKFGDGSNLKKGQIVIALGNPNAIARDGQASASWGIVANISRKDGAGSALHYYGMLIQTDAKLNLGTSGGALVNLKGEMVGLTVALASATGYEQSAGFAIPVNDAFRHAVDKLKQGREVEYGFLGVGVESLDPTERLRGRHGVRVQSVVPGTPARRVGVLAGDVITHVGGEAIHDRDHFMLAIGKLPAESSTILRIERGRRPQVIVVDELAKYFVRGRKIVTNPPPAWRGIQVDHVTASERFQEWSQHGLVDPQGSVVITEVSEDSPAWQQGLRPEMTISHVRGNRVATPRQFLDQVAGQTGPVTVRIGPRIADDPDRTIPPDPS